VHTKKQEALNNRQITIAHCTVATEKSIYQEYMERTLFHSELWGIFPIQFFPEADNKISTSPEIVHVNVPINIGKISMEISDILGFDLTTY
jgi:hypothetical protein